MLFRMVDELEFRTQVYWEIALCVRGRSKRKQLPTTHIAIAVMRDVEDKLSPHRPLHPLVKQLGKDIITGGKRKKPTTPPPNNVRKLRA